MNKDGEEEMGWTTDGIADGSEPYGDIVIGGDITAYGLSNRSAVTSITAENIASSNSYLFQNCSSLAKAKLNRKTAGVTGAGWFMSCKALKTVDIGDKINLIGNFFFGSCSSIELVILRYNDVVKLNNVNAFSGTPFASGGTGGKIYVPLALIESYQTATNWATLYDAGTIEFLPIEGSEYE